VVYDGKSNRILTVDGSAGNVGIGTATIPHAGVGYAKLALEGPDSDEAGPHVQFTTAADNYPLLQILPYAHDEIYLFFDAYFDGANKSSNVVSNYLIAKSGGDLVIGYDSGVAQGGAVTWNDGLVLTATGIVNIPGGVRTKISVANVSNPPTDAELDTAFGTPATVGDGFIAVIDDANAHTRFWMVFALGGAWAVEEFAKAS